MLLKVGSLANVRLWKNATGIGKSFDGQRTIAYGLKGSSDLIGIICPTGRFLAIEIKTGSAKQTKEQRVFQAMIERMGGLYIVARSVNDVFTKLNHCDNIV